MSETKVNSSEENNNKINNEIKLILEKNNSSIKSDIIYFKEDILKELKELKKDFYSKNNTTAIELQEKIDNLSIKNEELSQKTDYLSKIIDAQYSNNLSEEKNYEKEKIIEDIKRQILSNEIKLSDFREEFKIHKEQYNNIIKNNIIYKGKIGPGCIYKNMHQFIDYIISNINNLNDFKDKKIINKNNYEIRIEKMIETLNNQTNSILDNCKMYIKESNKKYEEKMTSEFKLYDSKLMETRIQNLEYSKTFELKAKELDEIFNKILSMKTDIYNINEKTKKEIFDSNDKINTLIDDYKNEFISIKEHFNALAEFFKDLKSKINLSDLYNRKDILNIANKINFYDDNIYSNNNERKGKRAQSAIIKNGNNINFELGGNNKDNINDKTIGNKSITITKDEKIGDDKDINMKYESNKNNDNSNNNNSNKLKVRKVLKNEKFEKYKFLYESNNNNFNNNINANKTNEYYNKKNYPDFCVKNYNNNKKEKNMDINIVVKNRNISSFHGIKNNSKNFNRSISKNDIDNSFFDNSFYTTRIYNNSNIMNNIKNKLERSSNFIIAKYYKNKMNKIYEKKNNVNKSIDNIFLRENDGNLFYKKLSNNKIKIKNLSCIK